MNSTDKAFGIFIVAFLLYLSYTSYLEHSRIKQANEICKEAISVNNEKLIEKFCEKP